MTTLSVLIPHYRDPEGLELALDSIEAQTWRGDTRVIVCDDGSEREHFERVEELVDESPLAIELLRNPVNRGRPYTRNVLLDAAAGKYTAWLDAGDEWYPTKIEKQLDGLYRARHLAFDRPVWATCNFDWQWEGSRRRLREQNVDGDQLNNLWLAKLGAYLWTTLGTTKSFKDVGYFDENLPRLQDLDFFIRFVAQEGMLILPLDHGPLCVYHKSDIGRQGGEVLACFRYLFDKHAPLLMARSRRFRRNRLHDAYLHAARFTLNNGEYGRTLRFLATAAGYSPYKFTKKMIQTRGRL
ncbi:MAG TPA: glycosyltransferase family A protein [Sandaracinaceae bacterium LLY-WYZ-13_1]|nr:glycosyltransferase family A protein [Sandaracinaceae bacterium LLY-WYZ-13_1]